MRNPNTKCEICSKPLYRRPFELKKIKHICCKNCRSDLYKKYKNYNAEGLKRGHGWNKGMSKSKGDNLSYGRSRSNKTKRRISEALRGKQRVERVKVICKECGKPFQLLPSQHRRSKGFCSVICSNRYGVKYRVRLKGKDNPNWRGGPSTITCGACGVEFETRKKTARYCSLNCKHEAHRRFMIETPPFVQTCNTDIERILEKWLMEHDVKFEKQKPIERTTITDFFIKPNLCLFADGDYWHSIPRVQKRDAWINRQLERFNYRVIRIKGSEIKEGVRPNI